MKLTVRVVLRDTEALSYLNYHFEEAETHTNRMAVEAFEARAEAEKASTWFRGQVTRESMRADLAAARLDNARKLQGKLASQIQLAESHADFQLILEE
jgi:hypothetical protein